MPSCLALYMASVSLYDVLKVKLCYGQLFHFKIFNYPLACLWIFNFHTLAVGSIAA